MFASEQQRDDVEAAREQWQAWQKSCDVSKLAFLDETSASTSMIRYYGRALAGARCKDGAHVKARRYRCLPAYKVVDVQALIEARGATMKYQPSLNSICRCVICGFHICLVAMSSGNIQITRTTSKTCGHCCHANKNSQAC